MSGDSLPAARRTRSLLAWTRWVGLALLGWGAWLSFPRSSVAPESGVALTAVLVDVSASLTRTRTGWEVDLRRDLQALAREAERRGDEFLVVEFAADVRRVFGPGEPGEFLRRLQLAEPTDGTEPVRFGLPGDRSLESRLEAALAAAEPELLEPRAGVSRLILRSDGSFTGADPGGLLSRLSGEGISIRLDQPRPEDRVDLALARLDVPERPELGSRVAARCEIVARQFDPARHRAHVEVQISGNRGLQTRELEVELSRSDGALRSTCFVDLGEVASGETSLEARVVLELRGRDARGDSIPENDVQRARFRSREGLLGLVLTRDEASARRWLGAFPAGLDFLFRSPEQLTDELERADFCLALELPLPDLDAALLYGFMRRGGGVLVAGGWPLLADWDNEEAAQLAEAMPLSPDTGDLPPRDVQFVVDGSGSMSGAPFDAVRSALVKLVPATPRRDRVSLRFFTGALQPRILLQDGSGEFRGKAGERVRELLSKTVPGGQTFLIDSLEGLAREREREEKACLVLLLTDGHETSSFQEQERAQKLAEQFATTRTTLEVFAVGEDPNLPLLEALLPEGKLTTRITDFRELDEVFQRRVNRERVEDGPLALGVGSFPGGQFMGGVAEALSQETPPTLARALRMRARDGVTVLLRTESGNPVLAIGRVGLGKLAVLATGPGESWSGELRLNENLEPLLRSLGREARLVREPRLVVGDRLLLENAPPDWPLQLEGRLTSPAEGRDDLVSVGEFRLPSELHEDPRSLRESPAPGWLEGLPAGIPLVLDLEWDGGRARLRAASPGPPEFRAARALRLPAGVSSRETAKDLARKEPHPAAPWILVLGLILSAAGGLKGSET